MKNEKGITLVALVITIIVIFILAGISANYGVDSLNESKSKKLTAELEMVEQAIAEQYIKAVELGYIGKTKASGTETQPEVFAGKIITEISNISKPSSTIVFELENYYSSMANKNEIPYEKYYYRLEAADLEKLKIENNENTYVVNYETGEVYNETKKQTSKGDILYYKGKSGANSSYPTNEIEKNIDNTSFTE